MHLVIIEFSALSDLLFENLSIDPIDEGQNEPRLHHEIEDRDHHVKNRVDESVLRVPDGDVRGVVRGDHDEESHEYLLKSPVVVVVELWTVVVLFCVV